MVKVVKSQPADHSTKGTESAVLTTDHVVSSDQFKNSSTKKKKYMRAYETPTQVRAYVLSRVLCFLFRLYLQTRALRGARH